MKFSGELRFKEIDNELTRDIILHIQKGDDIPGLYVVYKPENANLLEFFEYSGCMTEYAKRLGCTVVGLALGKQKAIELIYEIISEYYLKNGSLESFKKNL